jgi:quinohemoprotein ethanol dehydrogenase
MTLFYFKRIGFLSAFLLFTVVGCNRNEPSSPANLAAIPDAAALQGANALLLDDSAGDDWPAFGRTYGEQHFSPLTQIADANIKELGLAWYLDLGPGNPVTGPLAVDGILYFATGYSVVQAVDPRTGKQLWQYDPRVTEVAGRRLRMGWGIRGIAYWNGKIYTGTHDGRLLALDARSGKLLWSVMTLEEGGEELFISGPPRVFDGKVIIGNGGADQASVRGFVTTYDAETGEKLWRFHTVPGNPADGFEDEAMAMAAKTWYGEWWKHGGGGTVWNAMTYDADADVILLGVGNGAPWNHRIRSEGKGDNLFLASIVALDANTGEYRWHYQVNPGEAWDYNASMDMQLADLEIDGRLRKVVMTAPKNGFFYVIDRTNGKLISAEPFVKVSWASHIDLASGRPQEDPAARYPDGSTFVLWPSPLGAHSWLPMAFHPGTGLVYIPAIETATAYNDVGIDTDNWQRVPGNAVDGGTNPDFVVEDAGPLNGTSSLLAWDPVAQKKVWQVSNPGPWNGGALATAGNLVFQGQIDSTFNAYAADSGRKLWSYDTAAAVLAPPISYAVDGVQYVTVLTGMGTSAAAFGPLLPASIDYRTEAKRVLTFALQGRATLPAAKHGVSAPVEDADFIAPAEENMAGLLTYARRCAICHGVDLIAAGQAPDLRSSTVILADQPFAAVVRDGLLQSRGMPRFEELTDQALKDLRDYIRNGAAKWRLELHSKATRTE